MHQSHLGQIYSAIVEFLFPFDTYFILKTAVGREKDVQDIDVNREFEKRVVTLLVISAFSNFLGPSRACADFRDPTAVFRFITRNGLSIRDWIKSVTQRNQVENTPHWVYWRIYGEGGYKTLLQAASGLRVVKRLSKLKSLSCCEQINSWPSPSSNTKFQPLLKHQFFIYC